MFTKSKIKSGIKKMTQAQQAEGETADRLFQQAAAKFEEVIEKDAVVLEALHSWGLALNNQARDKTGKEAEDLFSAAYSKYSAASVIDPKSAEILNDWGAAMMDNARMGKEDSGESFYAQAQDKFLQADTLQPGIAAYNLACLDSIKNDFEACEKHLQAALNKGNLPSVEDVKNDDDLSNVSETEWFQKFVKTIPNFT